MDKVEDHLRRMGLNVRSAVMSIERPDARLRERGVISARGGTTSLRSVVEDLEVRDKWSCDEEEGTF